MNVILILGIIALIAMLIFWNAFRNWVGNQLNAIWDIIEIYAPALAALLVDAFDWVRNASRVYLVVFLITALLSLVLLTLSLLINSPILTAMAFILAICLMIVVWLPAGIILRVFKLTDGVIPSVLKELVAWVAFVGWLGLMCPDVLTFKSFLGAALVGFIFFGIAVKINALEKLVAPLVIVMCLWVAWGYFWPESFRATTRYTESWAKRIQTKKDRGSINNETDVATTYGQALQDIIVLYELNDKGILNDAIVDTVKMGTIVKLVSHKAEVKVIDGQGFLEIQLANQRGSYVRGVKYYVEAEYIQIASPWDVTPKNPDLLKNRHSKTSVSVSKVGGIFRVGEHSLALKMGEESDWCIIQSCHAYMFLENSALRVSLTFEDGSTVNSWELKKWPDKFKFKVKNLSYESPVLKVI